MALLPYEKHPGDTGTLTNSASTLQRKANLCLDQKKITDGAYNPVVDSWDGICAPELAKAPEPVRKAALEANKQLAWSAVPLNYTVVKINGFNTVAAQCQAQSEKADPKGTPPDAPVNQTNDGRARIRYGNAYETYIVDGFREAAGMFKDGPTPENIRLAGAAGAIPKAPVFNVFGSLWHEDNMKKAASEAEALIKKINEGKWTDSKELKALIALLKENGTDQMFSAMLINSIGPDGLVRLNQIVAQMTSDEKPDPYGDKDGGAQDPELGALIKQFQQNMSITLGTASGGQDGYDPGTRPEFRLNEDFLSELNDVGRKKTTIKWPGEDDYHYGTELYGFQVLAPLLTTGKFSSEFLTSVGNGMYYFDRTEGEHGGGPWMDTVATLRGDHGIRLDWTEGTGSTHAAGFDPLRGLMKAFANNPDAAHDWFTSSREYSGGGHDGTVGYNDKLRYLLNERQWNFPMDQPWQGAGVDEKGYFHKDIFERENNRHGMDPLGQALTAAVSGKDEASATLFGDVVYEVSQGDYKGDRYADVRDDFANMAVKHLGAINTALINDGGQGIRGDIDPVTKGVQYDPGFNTQNDVDLTRFLNSIGHDESAKTHLAGAEVLYAQAGYQHYMGSEGTLEQRMDVANGAINTPLGKIYGALDYGTNDATFEKHQESDQEHNDAVDTKYKVIGFFTDKLPFGKLPVGGDIAKMGVDGYLSALQESEHIDTTAVAQSLVGQLHSGSENKVQATTEAMLYASMSDKDKSAFGNYIPRDADGTPKPMSEWSKTDEQQFNSALRTPASGLGALTLFGRDAGTSYSNGYDAAQKELG